MSAVAERSDVRRRSASYPAEGVLRALDAASDLIPNGAPESLAARRASAKASLERGGLPNPRVEAWKYTNVRPLSRLTYEMQGPAVDDLESAIAPAPCIEGARRLVCVNNRLVALDGDIGVELLAGPELEQLGQLAEGRDGFSALNLAGFSAGACLDIAPSAGHTLYHIIHLAVGESNILALPRHLIRLAPGAEATVVETFLSSSGGTHLSVPVTEVFLAAGSTLDHYRVCLEDSDSFQIAEVGVEVSADADYRSHQLALGGRLVRSDVNVRLADTGARCTLNGLFVADGTQHHDMHTLVDHLQPAGASDELIKGVLDGRGHGVFNGRVVVHPDAQKTDARQANHNLLLSRDAEVDTKPQLEIFADDVKCSHGATVGQLDANMLFYLRSRGLAVAEARAMLTYAFAADVLERMGLAPVRAKAQERLAQLLPEVADMAQGER